MRETNRLLLIIEEMSPEKETRAKYVLEITCLAEADKWLTEKDFAPHWEDGSIDYWTHEGKFSMNLRTGDGTETLYQSKFPLRAHIKTFGALADITFKQMQ